MCDNYVAPLPILVTCFGLFFSESKFTPLKKNGRSSVAEVVGGVSEKTWRKWIHVFVKKVSYLDTY